jgi:hypothetical protein
MSVCGAGIIQRIETVMCLCKGESTARLTFFNEVRRTTVYNIKHNAGKTEKFYLYYAGCNF